MVKNERGSTYEKVGNYRVSFLSLLLHSQHVRKKETPEDRLSAYVNLWNDAEFTKMYDEYVSEASKEAFGSNEYIDRTNETL